MKFKNVKADRSGAYLQQYALEDLYGEVVTVTDTSGKGTVQITGILKGGKSPYEEFVVIVNEQIMFSFPHYAVNSIEWNEIFITKEAAYLK